MQQQYVRPPLPRTLKPQLLATLESAGILTGRVWQAIAVATLAHNKQRRFDGTPYLEQHVFPVAQQIALQGVEDTEEAVIIGLLHDVLEDYLTIERSDLEAVFGSEVADAVNTLTKAWSREKAADTATAINMKGENGNTSPRLNALRLSFSL
jgi:(p)ppGpp synthase/HD superfamily hydrolase